jgi:enoyl-CoA hydratase/carnithine racemase
MSAPTRNEVTVERPSDGVVLLTIDRAHRFNTLSEETLEALGEAAASLSADESVVAVVLRGAGGESFAAGADIREVAKLDPRAALAFSARGQFVLDAIERSPKVFVAAIDGYCLGGGLDLALSCDLRHASPRSVFAHPGAKLGIVTGFGGTARLARLVGKACAIEMFATARRVTAEEARVIGLVDTLASDPLDSALATARGIAERWPVAAEFLKGSALRWWRRGLSGR